MSRFGSKTAGLLLLIAGLVGSGITAFGQGLGEGLTLHAAVAAALNNNETAGIAEARVDEASAQRRRAVSALLPDFTISGSYTRRDGLIRRDFGTGENVTRPDAVRFGQASATLDLFNARAFPALSSAGKNLVAQRLESGELRRALAYDVAAGFYAVLSEELARDAAERRHETARRVVEDARIRREAGLAAANDVTRSELELATARLTLTRAESAVIDARLGLGRLVGGPVDGRLSAPDDDSLTVSPPESLEDEALRTRHDLRASVARAEALEKLAVEPLLGLIPSLSVRGIVDNTEEADRGGAENNWSLALLMSWPLYDGGDRYGLADQRRAQAREARYVSEALKNDVGLEIRRALNDLNTSRAAAEQARVAATVAEQNAVEVGERFANGLATALEQADATTAEFEARVEVARQRFALELADLAVRRALGYWPAGTEDLAGGVNP